MARGLLYLRAVRFLFSLLSLAGCASPLAIPDDTSLYEDDQPLLDGKADASEALPPLHQVTGYRVTREAFEIDQPVLGSDGRVQLTAGQRGFVIRRLNFDGNAAAIFVDADTLRITRVMATAFEEQARPIDASTLQDTHYATQLEAHVTAPVDQLVGDLDTAPKRFAVTVDMCQSSRSWARHLFDWLIELGAELGRPVPVGVAMTGLWALRHPDNFRELVAWRESGKLDIVWINHSYHHYLSHDANTGTYRFMTAPSVDLGDETTSLEVLLLQQGQVFSPFFRFPGLAHNESRLREVNQLGLFALDANAWIGKGQPIKGDAVVLLHGNGNEAIGITWFLDQATELHDGLRHGDWAIVDPHQALAPTR